MTVQCRHRLVSLSANSPTSYDCNNRFIDTINYSPLFNVRVRALFTKMTMNMKHNWHACMHACMYVYVCVCMHLRDGMLTFSGVGSG